MIDRQFGHNLLDRLLARFDRSLPQAILVYGRRAVPAPGFSLTELADAELTEARARELQIPIDTVRTNSIGANVESLRRYLDRQ